MQDQDQSEKIETTENTETILPEGVIDHQEDTPSTENSSSRAEEQASSDTSLSALAETSAQAQGGRFDWPALLSALAVAAFFALTARFNSQPSPSYIPAAVFTATGCGLLVTAIHKLRRRPGAALLEAGLSGFGMALLQFLVALTYPSVWTTVTTIPDYGRAFILTWGLIAFFAVVLSLAGATIGHLAFTPLRPLPARATKQRDEDDEAEEEDEQQEDTDEADDADASIEQNASAQVSSRTETEDAVDDEEELEDEGEVDDEEDHASLAAAVAQPQRPLINYAITVLLLGLLPMMAGYVFAASYDFLMNAINVNAISPALYPTLGLLSGLLPWRFAVPINLSGQNGAFIVFTMLWRVPDSVLGNPNLFDVQALESLVFSAAGLALLLITMYSSDNRIAQRRSAPWSAFLFLEALLGLILILPANLWLLRGLEGVFQMGGIVAALPTMQLLNPLLFTLNLVTGILFCLIIGLIVRRQYQLWTTPRVKALQSSEELDA